MRIAIAHNAVTDADAPDERDVLVQAAAVQAALTDRGHRTALLPCTLDLAALRQRLSERPPDLVVNLVEALDGRGRLIHLVPSLLDALGVPYTGSCAEALLVTSHKVLAKERMAALRLPTPPWIGPVPADIPALSAGDPAAADADPATPRPTVAAAVVWMKERRETSLEPMMQTPEDRETPGRGNASRPGRGNG